MDALLRDLYHLMAHRFERDYVSSFDYREITQRFGSCMDRVEEATDRAFHEELYGIVMEYLSLTEYNSFLWGLRLGLQLNAL